MVYTNPKYAGELLLLEQLENTLNARPEANDERMTQYLLVVVEHLQLHLDPNPKNEKDEVVQGHKRRTRRPKKVVASE